MSSKGSPPGASTLRRSAERLCREQMPAQSKDSPSLTAEDLQRTLHELSVHQIELELQNEELRLTQVELDKARERYFDLYNLAPVGYLTLTEKGLIQEANLSAASLLGLPRAELVGRSLASFLAREDQDVYYLHRNRLVERGAPGTCELRLTRTDVGTTWVRLDTARALGPDGSRVFRLVMCDITPQKEAESRARESHQLNELIVQNAQEGIIIYGLDLRYQAWSPYMEQLTGVQASEVLGRHPLEVFPFLEGAGVFERLGQVLSGGAPSAIEFSFEVPGTGRVASVSDISAPFVDSEGKIIGVIGMVADITARRQAEERQWAAEAKLHHSQKMESLGVLAGGVAHDMNNVLAAILAMASARLEKRPSGDADHTAFEVISKAAIRGREVVQSLLRFARQSPIQNHEVDLDLNLILKEEVRLLERTTLAKVRLEIDFAEDLEPIQGDASALAHAFMNLCVNAVDAMPEHGSLTLRTRNGEPGWIEAQVLDTGTGMPPEVLRKALDPFFTTKGVGKGTGLGLSMVYSTVKAHGGRLEISSEPGQGTCVTVRLPVSLADSMSKTLMQEPLPLERRATKPGLRVLLVDDDELVLSSMEGILETLGHTHQVARSGEGGLALLHAGFKPEVIILDLNMPGMGGAGMLEGLRALCPEVPVLLSSGQVDQVVHDLAKAHPRVSLLSKPFTMKELQEHLDNLDMA